MGGSNRGQKLAARGHNLVLFSRHSTFKHWNLSAFWHCLHSPSLRGPTTTPFAGWGQSLEDCFREERQAMRGPDQAGKSWPSSWSLLCPVATEVKGAGWRAPCHRELVILGSRQEVRCDPYLSVSIRGELASLVSWHLTHVVPSAA